MTMSRAALLVLLAVGGGCAGSPEPAPPVAGQPENLTRETLGPGSDLSAGYSLLYGVAAEEARVAGILMLRSAGDETKRVVTDIAAAATGAKGDLEAFAASGGVRLDAAGLPDAEVAARQIIAGWQQKKLVFGGDFERNLLLTQAEATQYMAALAQRLSETDTDPARIEKMKALAVTMSNLHERVAERLKPAE